MVLVWLALAVSLAAVVAAATIATLRGISFYRDAKRVGGAIADETTRIERTTAEIERHLQAAERSSADLSAATARLAVSRARLNVLLGAASEARAVAGRVTAHVPRK
jgi:hypothetical protein